MSVNGKRIIVSLTSFPGGIDYAPGAVRSILRGSDKPDKIVLYVTLSQFENGMLPEEIVKLERENEIFEIRNYDRDIRSYRKLVPALADFPEDIIITVDDDVDYHPHLVRDLLRFHKEYPGYIIAHRAKHIRPGQPYRKWTKYRWYHFLKNRIQPGFTNLQTGVGGVLYPPHSLKADMIDEDLFTQIAPTADDIWFWAAAVANGTEILPVPFGHNKPKGLGKPREFSLKAVNFKSGIDRNRAYFDAILEKYPEIKQRMADERRTV